MPRTRTGEAPISAVMPGLWAGRYELLERLATGGMGEIFIARQTTPTIERRVAIKMLLPHLARDPEFVRMFLDEARIASRMSHPAIVPVLDFGEAEGTYFLAMSLVEGVSLARLLRACRQGGHLLPVPVVRLVAQNLCDGLEYAHHLRNAHGEPDPVIHRDVSPHNLLVAASGAVMLTDFGIAKARDNDHRTRTGEVRGKLAYMAPEQLEGAAADPRIDIYSAAVTLYETLTLASPFQRSSEAQMLDAIRAGEVTDARVARREVSRAMAEGLARGLARAPHERFPSARALADALRDGPVATTGELGEWVERLCAEELRSLRRTAAPQGPEQDATASERIVVAAQPRVPVRRMAWWAAAAAAVLASLALGWWSQTRSPASDATQGGDAVARGSGASGAPVSPREDSSGPVGGAPAPGVGSGRAPRAGPAGGGSPQPEDREDTRAPQRQAARASAAAGEAATDGADDDGRAALASNGSQPIDPAALQVPVRSERAGPGEDAVATRAAQQRAGGGGSASRERTSRASASEGARTAAAKKTAIGFLTADAKPWAEVYVGSRRLERTPMSRVPLPVGEHVLRFRNAELGRERTRRVRIEKGKITAIRVDLSE